jgi:hypothetical protein
VAVRAQDDDGTVPHLDGQVTDLISQIDPARIQTQIAFLETFGTRNSCSTPDNNPNLKPNQGINVSQDYIFAQFSAIQGLSVAFAPYVHANCPNSPTRNVVAWLPGKRHPERMIVIGGHLDSRTFNVLDVNADTSTLLAQAGAPNANVLANAPAGNDAAAQTEVVLETARALASAQFDDTLVFISFSGEEQGLFGSADIAKNAGAAIATPSRLEVVTGIKGAKVVAMLNNDIPGGDDVANTGDDFQAFRLYAAGTPRERTSRAEDGTTDNTSPARGLMRFVATFGVPNVPQFAMRPELREDRPGRGSDQTSFINNQVPAVRFIESHECSSSPVDNSCPAALDPSNPNSALTNGRPCPSPYAALPRTDPRHNCLHTSFVAGNPTLDGVNVGVRVCANDDERANGVDIPNTPTPADPFFVLNKTLFEGCVDDTAVNPFHNFQRQHAPNDRPEHTTATYAANIAKVMAATMGNLARAPNPPTFTAAGDAVNGVTVTFAAAPGDRVQQFIIAARPTTANFHTGRVRVDASAASGAFVTPQQLGIPAGQAFFISVSALGNGQHESLFAYPEYRCDASSCVIPDGALNITVFK